MVTKPPLPESPIEALFAIQLRADKVLAHRRQHLPFADRKFALDFAWPHLWFAVECDGAVHRIHERWHGEIERGAILLLAGWKVLHVDGRAVRDGRAIAWTKEMLARLGASA